MIGQKIRRRRIEKGFATQAELAKKLGTDQSRVSRWERGENLPDEMYHDALLEALESDDSLLDIDVREKIKAKTVAEMAPDELIEAIAIATIEANLKQSDQLSHPEAELLRLWRKADDIVREDVMNLLSDGDLRAARR